MAYAIFENLNVNENGFWSTTDIGVIISTCRGVGELMKDRKTYTHGENPRTIQIRYEKEKKIIIIKPGPE